MTQAPIQRWLVLTEFGVELQPIGNMGIVSEFFHAIEPYRRRCTIVTETAYERAYSGATNEGASGG